MSDLRIRIMRTDEIPLAVNWAAAEGWNPGLADAACFATVDPQAFSSASSTASRPRPFPASITTNVSPFSVSTSCGRICAAAASGLQIWNAAIAHAGERVIGLDGVVAQQQNYQKSGFRLAYANVRYGGTVAVQQRRKPASLR